MLSICKRVKKTGECHWQAIVRIKGEKSLSRTFETWEEAHRFGTDAERGLTAAAVSANPEAPPAEPDLLSEDLGALVSAFVESAGARPRHCRTAPTVIRQVSGQKVADVRQRWVRDYIERMRNTNSKRGAPFSWSSISSHLVLISLAIRWRAEELDVVAPPFPRYMRHFPADHDPARERRLAPEEERALVRHFRSMSNEEGRYFRFLVLLAIETAARLQELIFADWSEFHFKMVQGKMRGWWRIPKEHTKTKKARTVPLSAKARRIVKAIKRLRPQDTMPFQPVLGSPTQVSERFRIHSKKAKLVGFRFHDLRHEGITRMILRRPDAPYKVMRAVGHSSIEMLNRYANLFAEDLLDLVD